MTVEAWAIKMPEGISLFIHRNEKCAWHEYEETFGGLNKFPGIPSTRAEAEAEGYKAVRVRITEVEEG